MIEMKTKEFTPVQRHSTFHTWYPGYVWRWNNDVIGIMWD